MSPDAEDRIGHGTHVVSTLARAWQTALRHLGAGAAGQLAGTGRGRHREDP
ncbi:hypothetical protein [Streptomyces sp. NPDC003006]